MAHEHDGVSIDRPGHATVRLAFDDLTVSVDPWSEVLAEDPEPADYVFVTHDDYDHYDPEGIERVSTAETTVVAYEAIDTGDLERDVETIGADDERSFDGFSVATTPAYNRPDGDHVDDDGTPFHAEGEVVGLLFDVDGTTVWYPSDTDPLEAHGGYDVDVFLPPIGGTYTMDRRQAADLARTLEPSVVIPVHYDTFAAIETDAAAFADELDTDGIDVQLL